MTILCELSLHARVTSESQLRFIGRKMLKEGTFKHLYMNAETVHWFLKRSKVTVSELPECGNWYCKIRGSEIPCVFCSWGLVTGIRPKRSWQFWSLKYPRVCFKIPLVFAFHLCISNRSWWYMAARKLFVHGSVRNTNEWIRPFVLDSHQHRLGVGAVSLGICPVCTTYLDT